jgi:hypothetical protein
MPSLPKGLLFCLRAEFAQRDDYVAGSANVVDGEKLSWSPYSRPNSTDNPLELFHRCDGIASVKFPASFVPGDVRCVTPDVPVTSGSRDSGPEAQSASGV